MHQSKQELIDQIESRFIDNSCGLFEEFDRANLRSTIRISVEFRSFLENLPSAFDPKEEEMEYVNGTIRSGMDCYYHIKGIFAVITSSKQRTAHWQAFGSANELRAIYYDLFEQMAKDEVELDDRLYYLLELVKLKLVFMAMTFN